MSAPVIRLDARRHYGALAEARVARLPWWVRGYEWCCRHETITLVMAGLFGALCCYAAASVGLWWTR